MIENQHHYNRYLKFISSLPNRDKPKKPHSGLNGHHIVPRSFGGSDTQDNIKYITHREHYLCHWMLAKALGGKMWFAFNAMSGGGVYSSTLFNHSRKYVCKLIGDSRRGMKMCHDPITQVNIYYIDTMPDGMVAGASDKSRKNNSESVSALRFIYNPTTGEQLRIHKDLNLPDGFVFGRINGHTNGLHKMNASGVLKVYDLKTRSVVLSTADEYKNNEYQIVSPCNAMLLIYKNYIFESLDLFLETCGDLPRLTQKTLHKKFIQHHNMTEERRYFCIKHEGMSYYDYGFRIIQVDKYDGSLDDKIILRKVDYGCKVDEFRRSFEVGCGTQSKDNCPQQ